jgi:hypothetical protein
MEGGGTLEFGNDERNDGGTIIGAFSLSVVLVIFLFFDDQTLMCSCSGKVAFQCQYD